MKTSWRVGVLILGAMLGLSQVSARADGLDATYWDNPDFTGTSVTRVDPTVDFDWAEGAPFSNFGVNDFSTRWTGKIKPAYSQTYTFYLAADDGCRLWVNGVKLIDDWAFNSNERTATIALTANTLYPIKVEYLENSGWAGVHLSWSSSSQSRQIIPATALFSLAATPTATPAPTATATPTPTPTPTSTPVPGSGDGLSATYWDNADFTGTSSSRVDSTVNFDWGGGAPVTGFGSDTFSARWTGQVKASSTGTYTFTTTSDDGARLWVNNQLLVDKWVDQGTTSWSGTITLTAGQKYPIKMEYFENGGGASAKLSWSGPGIATQIIPQARLFSSSGTGTSTALFGVNLSGAESNLGTPYYDYPNTRNDGTSSYVRSLDYYKNRGRRVIRVPFAWERMQPALNGALSSTETAKLDSFLNDASTRGMLVILDCHNYGSYNGQKIGVGVSNAAFADFWQRIAQRYGGRSVIYGYDLMNEPVDFPSASHWPVAAQAAINAIRTVDTGTSIFVEGDAYSHAWEWPSRNGGLISLNDPSRNLVFEAHEYFDPDRNGDYQENISPPTAQTAIDAISPFVNWCKSNNVRGFLGEFAVPNTAPGSRAENDAGWNAMLDGMLTYLRNNNIGGTYWAGGPRWDSSERISIEPLSIDPQNIAGTIDRPQMGVLKNYPG